MAGEKKVLPTFRVYNPSDLSHRWFVYWYEGSRRIRRYGDINRHNTVAARQQAAERLIGRLKADILRKISRTEERLVQYLAENKGRWRPRTVEQYESIVTVLLEWLAGQELSQGLLEAFLVEIQNSRHPTTYNKYVAILKRLLRPAGYDFLFSGIEKAKANPTPAKYFQKHQAQRLLRAIDEKDRELGLFVRFMYYCFLRPAELRFLRAGDIMIGEGEIRVPGATAKNDKTQFIVIPDPFLPSLDFLYHLSPGDFLFPSPVDASKPISKNVMYNRHKAILDSLNFGPGYTLYSWKHTGAVAAAKAGISIKELQLQLRHHSLDETDKYLRQMGVKDLSRLKENFPAV